MSSPRAIRIPPPGTPIRRGRSTRLRRVGRWRKSALRMWRKLNALPKAVRIVVIAATILAVFSATNLVYHLVRKPTEVFAPVSGAFNKAPGRRKGCTHLVRSPELSGWVASGPTGID
jgi:hypothetical protein